MSVLLLAAPRPAASVRSHRSDSSPTTVPDIAAAVLALVLAAPCSAAIGGGAMGSWTPVPQEPAQEEAPGATAQVEVEVEVEVEGDTEPRTTIVETVTVSANAVPVPVRSAGSSVTVIDAAEIERRDKTTVSELLRTVPGLEVNQTGGPGKATSVRLRGGDASHTLVLVDGVRINTATTGDVDFADLTTDNLERIEILRGPQAAYGSEAMAGVISIVTARGKDALHGRLRAEAGNLDTRRFLGSLGGGSERFDYSASLSDSSTAGVSHASERTGNTEPDPYDNRTLAGRLGVAVLGDARLDLSLRSFTADNALDDFFGDDPNARAESQGLSAALALRWPVSRVLSQFLQVGTARHELEGIDPDSPFNNYLIESETLELRGQSDLRLVDANTFSIGYSVENRQAENLGSFDEAVTLSSLWLQNLWSPTERVNLAGALRYDDHTTFDDETTWRLTASFAPRRLLRLHGSLGTSFRAPDMNELYFPFAGNAGLLPEQAEGFDLGVEQRFSRPRITVDLSWFAIDFDQLIVFDLTSFTFANVAMAESEGLEATLSLELGDRSAYRLDLSHTYNQTEDLGTGLPLARRPRNRSTLSFLFAPSSRLDGVLSAFSVRDRIDATGLLMTDYVRLDLGLRVNLGLRLGFARFRPSLRVENLLDRDYEEVPAFTSPGRVAVLGLLVEL